MNEMMMQDVTLQQPTSKKFTPTWKRFQAHENPHLPVMVLDPEGNVQQLTAAARRLLEYRTDEPVRPCFFSYVHSKNLYQVMRDVADMVCHGKGQAVWLLRLRTGQNRWRWFKAEVSNRLKEEAAIAITLRDLQDL